MNICLLKELKELQKEDKMLLMMINKQETYIREYYLKIVHRLQTALENVKDLNVLIPSIT